MNTMIFRSAILFLFLVGASVTASAQWAENLFPIRTHDFGTVAAASKTEFEFPIRNRTAEAIHIQQVRASCGCTTPILKDAWIQPGGDTILTARFNTSSFQGKKGATLTVVIDRPRFAEVQLRVDGYIRRDIVFNPGAVEFDKIEGGKGAEKRVAVAYAGRSDWQILGVEASQPHLSVTVQEKGRTGQRVDYDLLVQIRDDAPAGFFQEEVIVRTNDRAMPRVPLLVSAEVLAPLSVGPATFSAGTLKPGDQTKQLLIVKGQQPFTVTNVTCEGFQVQFQSAQEAKEVQMVQLVLTAGNLGGAVKSKVIVHTDLGESVLGESIVTGEIVAPQ